MATIPDLLTTALTAAPALSGTPKQVTWAHDIRQQLATHVQDTLMRRDAQGYYAEDMGITGDMISEAQQGLAYIFSITDAKFWIDHRTRGLQGMIRAHQRQAGTLRSHAADYEAICLSLQAMGL